MIFVLQDEDGGVVAVYQGPNQNMALVGAGIDAAHQNKVKDYEAANPRPGLSAENAHLFNTGWAALALTNQPDYIAWSRDFPARPTLRNWFVDNGYKDMDHVARTD